MPAAAWAGRLPCQQQCEPRQRPCGPPAQPQPAKHSLTLKEGAWARSPLLSLEHQGHKCQPKISYWARECCAKGWGRGLAHLVAALGSLHVSALPLLPRALCPTALQEGRGGPLNSRGASWEGLTHCLGPDWPPDAAGGLDSTEGAAAGGPGWL